MGTFAIFALILTTAYIIYYGVVITKDILSSRKTAEESDAAETLDTSFMQSETTEVTEFEPSTDVAPVQVEDDVPETEPAQSTEEILDMVNGQMNMLQPEYSDPISDEEYYSMLVNPGICINHRLMIESQTIHPDGTTEGNSVEVPIDEI